MPATKVFNPFYPVLVVAGVVFGITALAYASASTIAQRNPEMAADALESGHGLIALMDNHGFKLLMIELAVLGMATVLAIGTDDYWTKRAEAKNKDTDKLPKS